MQKPNFKIFTIAFFAIFTVIFSGCSSIGSTNSSTAGSGQSNETAATVNGKAIKLEEVERAVKQQAQGQESKLSPLELAQLRLQALESLIQQEVMFQKAEKEVALFRKTKTLLSSLTNKKLQAVCQLKNLIRD
ncbi:MAG: SurA N-terminal domain-containing protein [Pyrinomonadaceae bacterium]